MCKKEIIRVLVFYITIATLLVFAAGRASAKFSEGWLDRMINSRGTGIQLTTDPCAYAIVGDPDAGDKYIKLIVRCSNGKQSWNTFDTRAIKSETLEQLLNEFQRINGIQAEISLYKCSMNNNPIDLTTKLYNSNTVECRYE